MLAYDQYAMGTVANTVLDQPEKYEALVSRVAELDPSYYFALGEYCAAPLQRSRRHQFPATVLSHPLAAMMQR
jgi:hypothetical protein